jgi:hypothetical protein
VSRRGILLVLCCLTASFGAAGENRLRNPSFETDADRDGQPDHWAAEGDRDTVEQTLRLDTGRDGRRCARLACTRFRKENPASHAMVCQLGIPVQRGKVYRVSLWVRAEGIVGEMVSVALSDTETWQSCGLQDGFLATREWVRHEFHFRAERTCGQGSRFQIWFASTGTLWLDDVEFVETGEELYRPGHSIPADDRTNRVPNASFECGTGGWGSAEWDKTAHWGGSMNRLFGTLDTEYARHGRQSLRIHLSPENQPVSYFDYFEMHRVAIRAPLTANIGWIEVEPEKPYALSAYLKAAKEGTPARLAVREFQGGHHDKAVRVGTDWQRHALRFRPSKKWCYVLAGPDLRESEEQEATVWVDAVQLERGTAPTPFQPRSPVELALATEPEGRFVGDWERPPGMRVNLSKAGDARPAELAVRVTDIFDHEVLRLPLAQVSRFGEHRLDVFGNGARGYYRVQATLDATGAKQHQSIRLALVPPRAGADSRFGVNHAYPWPHLLDLCRKAGLTWVRDWSLKWHDIEPEKGRFTFEEADQQIDRVLDRGLRVLAMVPFPSSRWASTADAKLKARTDYRGRCETVAMAPRDAAEFENFVFRTVSHYKGRIRWWQVFNEPVFTTYSLPRKHGYTGKDYARWTQAFVRAARRADPNCKILAGIGYVREGQILEDWEQFLAAGGAKGVDAVDIHHYPRLRPPEFIEPLLERLNALMDRHGGRKPIWCTEYGYYADDEPWAVPLPHHGFNRPLESEALQAAYAVRWASLLFANGVEKIFYHAGTCDGVNRDSLQGIFFEYGGQPHKVYAAQAVMAHLLTPSCRFVRRLHLGEGVRGYLFQDTGRAVAVVWAPKQVEATPVRIADARVELWDMAGRRRAAQEFTPRGMPAYLVGEGLSAKELAAALR